LQVSRAISPGWAADPVGDDEDADLGAGRPVKRGLILDVGREPPDRFLDGHDREVVFVCVADHPGVRKTGRFDLDRAERSYLVIVQE
jgi:hypothetical protein